MVEVSVFDKTFVDEKYCSPLVFLAYSGLPHKSLYVYNGSGFVSRKNIIGGFITEHIADTFSQITCGKCIHIHIVIVHARARSPDWPVLRAQELVNDVSGFNRI